MTWQNPIAWLGLVTVALPILVHLFSRRQTRVLSFPSLRFLDVSRLLPTRRTQITDLALLLLRIAILLAATAALSQPLWKRSVASANTPVTAIVVDTLATRGDTIARAAVEDSVRNATANGGSVLRINTSDIVAALPGAGAWLGTQNGQRRLVVFSDFRRAVDSSDFAALARDVSLRLVAAGSNMGDSSAIESATVWWAPARTASTQNTDVRNTTRESARALGAIAIVDGASHAKHEVVIATPTSDSVNDWTAAAKTLNAPWMGDAILRLRSDTTLTISARQSIATDTSIGAPFVTLARTANNAPLVIAASLKGASADRLLLIARSADDALTTAALLLAASRAVTATRVIAARASTPDRARLSAWEHAPTAPATAQSATPTDFSSGPSDARWIWIAVLALLLVETVMRARLASQSSTQQGGVQQSVAQP